VDLVAIVTETSVDAELQRTALKSEAETTRHQLPGTLRCAGPPAVADGLRERGRSLASAGCAHARRALGIVRPTLIRFSTEPPPVGGIRRHCDGYDVNRKGQSPRSGMFSHIRLAVTMASRSRRLLQTTPVRDLLQHGKRDAPGTSPQRASNRTVSGRTLSSAFGISLRCQRHGSPGVLWVTKPRDR